MRIDCHVHTYRSGDSRAPVSRVLEAAQKASIDLLCITDHGTIDGALEAKDQALSYTSTRSSSRPLAVVVGQECRTWAGEIIGLFLKQRIPQNLQPHEVVEAIKEQGALVYIPHPFCPEHKGLRQEILEELVTQGLVDIIESHNAKAKPESNARATEFASKHGIAQAAASDAHYPEFVGRAFVEAKTCSVDEVASNSKTFLEAIAFGSLHRGRYSYAEARWQWSS